MFVLSLAGVRIITRQYVWFIAGRSRNANEAICLVYRWQESECQGGRRYDSLSLAGFRMPRSECQGQNAKVRMPGW